MPPQVMRFDPMAAETTIRIGGEAVQACVLRLLRRAKPRPARPIPRSPSEAGSGTDVGVPITLLPGDVPNENVAPVMVVVGVTPEMSTVKDAD